MKNFLIGVLITALAFVFVPQFTNNIGSVETNDLGYNEVTNSATSTSVIEAVTVLEANASRQYVRICNNSDTKIFLTLGATSTTDDLIAIEQGIQLNTVGLAFSCWEITPENNLFFGNIHATTTGGVAKQLIYSEK